MPSIHPKNKVLEQGMVLVPGMDRESLLGIEAFWA
jgi:hypothetical protein